LRVICLYLGQTFRQYGVCLVLKMGTGLQTTSEYMIAEISVDIKVGLFT